MIEISYPWAFAAVVLPLVLSYFLPKANENNSAALKVPFFNQLVNTFSIASANKSVLSYLKYLALLIWLLIVISACGIKWLGKPLTIPQSGRDLMLAIDLSGSMQTPDMVIGNSTRTRIDVVKQVAREFISNRNGDRMGLILFGTRAYLQTPLTFDRKTVMQMLDDATIGIAGPETAIGDAIGLGVKQMMKYPDGSKALVLLTDGGNNAGVLEPLNAAKLAKMEHIKIYTIGLGAREMKINTLFGTQIVNPSNDLDIDSLKKIAEITGGQFFRAEDGNSLKDIYSQINQLEPIKADNITVRPITPLYPWTLGLALILSFILLILKMRKGLIC